MPIDIIHGFDFHKADEYKIGVNVIHLAEPVRNGPKEIYDLKQIISKKKLFEGD